MLSKNDEKKEENDNENFEKESHNILIKKLSKIIFGTESPNPYKNKLTYHGGIGGMIAIWKDENTYKLSIKSLCDRQSSYEHFIYTPKGSFSNGYNNALSLIKKDNDELISAKEKWLNANDNDKKEWIIKQDYKYIWRRKVHDNTHNETITNLFLSPI